MIKFNFNNFVQYSITRATKNTTNLKKGSYNLQMIINIHIPFSLAYTFWGRRERLQNFQICRRYGSAKEVPQAPTYATANTPHSQSDTFDIHTRSGDSQHPNVSRPDAHILHPPPFTSSDYRNTYSKKLPTLLPTFETISVEPRAHTNTTHTQTHNLCWDSYKTTIWSIRTHSQWFIYTDNRRDTDQRFLCVTAQVAVWQSATRRWWLHRTRQVHTSHQAQQKQPEILANISHLQAMKVENTRHKNMNQGRTVVQRGKSEWVSAGSEGIRVCWGTHTSAHA